MGRAAATTLQEMRCSKPPTQRQKGALARPESTRHPAAGKRNELSIASGPIDEEDDNDSVSLVALAGRASTFAVPCSRCGWNTASSEVTWCVEGTGGGASIKYARCSDGKKPCLPPEGLFPAAYANVLDAASEAGADFRRRLCRPSSPIMYIYRVTLT
ncbi:hypothetical protein VUR80DRAFT_5155 [Thermomyces stellatus]